MKIVNITFEPIEHRYFDADTGEEYISVTTLLSKYYEEFQRDTIAEKYAFKHGKNKEDVIAEWEAINKEAVDYGNLIHNTFENFLNGKGYDVNNDMLNRAVNSLNWFISNFITGKIYPEYRVYHPDYKVCGTSDLPEIVTVGENKVVNIWDYKTNKKGLEFGSDWKRYMLPPIDHMEDCSFVHYEIQLSIYMYFFECRGFIPGKIGILWVNPKNMQIIPIMANYRKQEVIDLLTHYKQNYLVA